MLLKTLSPTKWSIESDCFEDIKIFFSKVRKCVVSLNCWFDCCSNDVLNEFLPIRLSWMLIFYEICRFVC